MLRVIPALVCGLALAAPGQQAEPEVPRDASGLEVAPRPHERPAFQPGGIAGEFKTANDLLVALEKADADLQTLTASVVYDRTSAFEGDRQVRTGRLSFRNEPQGPGKPPLRRFAAEFDKLYLGRRLEEEPKQYIFDGIWMAEKQPKQKLCNRQQVVGPGETFDPLKIGEGPLPIPIGQKRDDILSRFEAELVPPESGLAPAKPDELSEEERVALERLVKFATAKGTSQVRLTPREGADTRVEFSEVRLWYRRDKQGRLLPHMARTVKATGGDVSIVQLTDVKTNDSARIDPAIFSTEIPPGWDGRQEEWREAGEPDGAGDK